MLTVYIFAPPGCDGCEIIEKNIIPRVKKGYDGSVRCVLISVKTNEDLELQLLYEKRYAVESDESVKAFAGRRCIIGARELYRSMETVIDEELMNGAITPTPEEILTSADEDIITYRYSRITTPAVALGGLSDGINPCAFATLVFFVSVLSLLRKEKREIFIVGLVFAAAVFATYLLIGVALFQAIKSVSAGFGISSAITWAMAGFAVVMGLFSLADAVRYRRSSDETDIRLKLPGGLRRRINRLIREKMGTGHIAASAAVLGVAVTLLEATCTGQIYLPIVVKMIERKGVLSDALPLLILYNAMFVLPILVVFALALWGTSSRKISAFFSRHVALSKVLMAGVFFFLGIWLLAGRSLGV